MSQPDPTATAAGVYATDPDAFTEPWYQRRAAAYADDARKLVRLLREYEDVHPADAPCLAPLTDAIDKVWWRGHVSGDASQETAKSEAVTDAN